MPQEPEPSNPKSNMHSSRALVFSALIVGCIAAGISGFNFYCTVRSAAQYNQFNTALLALSKSQAQQYQSLQNAMNALKKSSQQETQTKLAETAYLIRLANLQLTLNRDAPLAVKTLLIAQQQLSMISDFATSTLKRTLAADITALQAAPVVDTNGLISKLKEIDALEATLSTLPAKPTVSIQKTINDIKSVDVSLPWYQRIWESVKSLKSLFVIRHLDHSSVPLIDPNEVNALKFNIAMQLNIAQWAVLHKQQSVFQSSLTTISSWLLRYFPVSDLRNTIENKINALEKIDIHPSFPTLLQTLTALRHVQMMELTPPSSGNTAATPNTVKKNQTLDADKKSASATSVTPATSVET